MKVLLIEPPKPPVSIGGEDVFIFEPLALEYVAAGVSSDHDVRILDMRLERDLLAVLEEFQPDVVGVTAYTVHVNTVINLCGGIKKWNPEVLTVMPTRLPLKEFYREYCRLYKRAISPVKGLAFVAQYPWKEIPSILAKTLWWYKRLRMTYLDYENAGSVPALSNRA